MCADIVKGTIYQAFGKSSVNCLSEVEQKHSDALKVQNKNSNKVSELCNRVSRVLENSVGIITNCQITVKLKVNLGLGNKREPKTVQLCRGNSKIKKDSLFEDVNKFACLQQLSDNNTLSVVSDNSNVVTDGFQLDNKNCTQDVVTESSNTQVSTSKHVVNNARKNSNFRRNANSNFQSKALYSSQVATSYVTNDSSIQCNAAGTVSPVTFHVSESKWHVNKCTEVATDSNPDKYDIVLRFRPNHRETVAKAKHCNLFKDWDSQTADKYGFIPLSEMVLPEKN